MGTLFAIFFGLTRTVLGGAVVSKIKVITFKVALATGVTAGWVIQKGRNIATWVIGGLRKIVDEPFCFFFGLNTLIVTLITPLTIALNTGVKKAAEWAIQNVGHIKHLVAAGLESIVVCPFGLFLRFGITILRGGATLTVGLITTLRRTLDSGDARAGPWVKQKAIKILEWVSQRGYTVAELTVRLIKHLKMLNTGARRAEVFVMQNVHNLTEWTRARLGSMVGALFALVSWLKSRTFGLGVAFTFELIRRFQTSLNFGATGTGAWVIQKVSQVIEWVCNGVVGMRGALFGLFLGLIGAVFWKGPTLAVGLITPLFTGVTGAGAWVIQKVKNLVEWVMDKGSTVLHLLGSGFGSVVTASFGSFLHFGRTILGSAATLIVGLTRAATRAAAFTIQNVRRIKNLVAAGLGSTVGDPFVFFLRLGITLLVVECVCNGVQSITGALFGLILGSIMLWDQLALTAEQIRTLENSVFRSHMHNLTSKALCRIRTHWVRKHGVHSLCLFVKVWSSTNSRCDNITKNSSRCWSSTCKCFDNSNSEKNTKLGPMWPDGGVSLGVPFRLRRRLRGLSSIHRRNININEQL